MKIILSLIPVFLLAQFATAALPDLSDEEKHATAKVIVTGHVDSVSRDSMLKVYAGQLHKFSGHLSQVHVEKGKLSGTDLTFHFKKMKFFDGACGNSGQRKIPEENTFVRLFLSVDDLGKLHLLEPNGWEELPVGME